MDLSEKERRLLHLLVGGASNKQCASELGIGLRTLEQRRQNLTQKLGATTAFQLGFIAGKCGATAAPVSVAT